MADLQRPLSVVAWLLAGLVLGSPGPVAAQADHSDDIDTCVRLQDTEPLQALDLADLLIERHSEGYTRLAALACRAWALIELERPDEARTTINRLTAGIRDQVGPAMQPELWRKAGAVMHRLDDRLAATDYYALALQALRDAGSDADRIPLLINLGVLYSQMEQHERAIGHYDEALTLMETTGEDANRVPVLFNLALTHSGLDQHDRAAAYLEQALQALPENAPPLYYARIHNALAMMEVNRGNPEAASAQLARARERLAAAGTNAFMQLSLDITEANLLLERGRPEAAIERARSALEAAREGEFGEQIRGTMSLLAHARAEAGQWQAALETYRQWFALRQAFLIEQNREQLAAIEAHLSDRRQARELERLRNEQTMARLSRARQADRQRVLWIAAGVILIGGTAVLVWQRRVNRRLNRLSRTDTLTGLPNRRDLGERVASVRQTPDTSGLARVVFLIDLDDFKAINDRYGHETGDAVLRTIARRLADTTRKDDWSARWGGEEFLVSTGDMDPDAATDFCRRLISAVSTHPVTTEAGLRVQVTASAGFAPWRPGTLAGPDFEAACRLADTALYGAKSAGRNTWQGIWPDADWSPTELDAIARDPARTAGEGRVQLITPG